MNQRDQTSGSVSTMGLWFLGTWFSVCLAVYFLEIPPKPFATFQYLETSFQNSAWTMAQVAQTWISHFLWAVTFLLTLIVFLGTGKRLLGMVGPVFSGLLENWVWCLALGLVFWGLLSESIALNGLLYPNLMKVVLVGAAGFVLVLDGKESLSHCWPFSGAIPLPGLWKGALAFIAFLSLANLLAPEMSWDAMTYQLILPKFYFLRHGFYPVLGIVPSQYPSLGQMFFSWGLIWGNDSLARGLCFLAHLGTALALVALGARLDNPRVGWTAAVFYWAFPYLNIYSTRGYVDLFANFYSFLGLGTIAFLCVRSRREPGVEFLKPDLAYAFLGVLSLGIIWGIKYNAAGFWMAGLFLMRGLKTKAKPWIWATLLGAPIFFLGPWALKSWAYTHNPFYPYLSGLFQSFDWNDFDQKASAVKFHVEGWMGVLKLPRIAWGLFFKNYSGAPNEEVSLIALFLFPLLIIEWKRIAWRNPILVVGSIPFFFWLVTSHQLRLISAVGALVSLLVAAAYTRFGDRRPSLLRTSNLILGIYLWIVAFYLLQGLVLQPNPFANFLGFQSRYQFLGEILRPEGYLRVADEMNRKLPEGAEVLIIGQQNGYYLNRVSAYDFDYTYPILKKIIEKCNSPEGIYSGLRELGFTYLLYNSNSALGTAVRVDELGVERYPWKDPELRNYEQFFLHYTQKIPLPVSNGYSLYEIAPRDGFSVPPEFLPGTETLYLRDMAQIMGLPKISSIVGKPLSQETYLETYLRLSGQQTALGYPCFQWAFAQLAGHPDSVSAVLKKGGEGFRRNGDKASWLSLQGDACLVEKKPSKAIPLFLEAENLSPEREDLARNLTVAYYNEHDLKNASLQADRAAALAPFSEEYQQLARQLKAAVSAAAR